MKTRRKSDNQSRVQQESNSKEFLPSRFDAEIPYPDIELNYPKLAEKDLRLAEALRLCDPAIPPSEKRLNPLQVRVGRKGRLWVNVMLERKQGVRIHDLERIMHVYGKPGRGRFISGRIRIERLPELNELAVRIQTGRPVAPALDHSVAAIAADHNTLGKVLALQGIDGTGVIVGIVDVGCDFYHKNFKINKETRLLSLWDQNGDGIARPKNYEYGIEYTSADINEALKESSSQKAYQHLHYAPKTNAHGTHVIDIAAGSSPDIHYLGVAPKANIIFVDLRRPTENKNMTEEELTTLQQNTLGSSQDLVDAVRYIFEKADELKKPAVVNISLAANGGGHNGTSLVEDNFDDLLSERNSKYGHAIVIAAGNDFQNRLHTTGRVAKNGSRLIKWRIPKLTRTTNFDIREEMEIWYPKGTALKIEVLDPHGNSVDELLCRFGKTCRSNEISVMPIWTIQNAEADPAIDQQNNHIEILVDNCHPNFQKGTWTFKLSYDETRTSNNNTIVFHAWIESMFRSSSAETEGGDSVFPIDSERLNTINGIGTARLPIVVGACAYDHNHPELYPVASYSSAGPSLHADHEASQKPELYAPGNGISSACAVIGGRFDADPGTSMAAPHVTGVIALMFQRAHMVDPNKVLTMEKIRQILIETASGEHSYDSQLGFGRVNGCDALNRIPEIL